MTVKQFSVFLENKKGTLAEVLKLLSAKNVGIRALSIADTSDFGILRFIASNNEAATEALKEEGCIFSLNEVIAAKMSDQPGGLAELLELLADNGVEVEYLYAFVIKSGDQACVIVRVNDNETATKLLTEANIPLMTQEDIVSY